MTIALVAHALIASTSAGGTSAGMNTNGASLLVLAISELSSNPAATPTDSLSNTWTALPRQLVTGGASITIWYVAAPKVGTGHTVTINTAGNFPSAEVAAFSGVATTSPVDVNASAADTVGSASIQPGSVTPSQANSLIVTGYSSNTTSVANSTINLSFTILDQTLQSAGVFFAGAMAYLLQGAASAVNPTWTNSTAPSQSGAAIAVFKPEIVTAEKWLVFTSQPLLLRTDMVPY